MDAYTARSSFDRNSATKRNPSGLNHLKQALPSRSLTALSTPHDQILEKMYKHPGKSESALPLPIEVDVNSPPPAPDDSQRGDAHHMSINPIESNTYPKTGSRSLNEPVNARDGAVSATPTASFASNPFPATRLYDPFDGSPLGIIVPAELGGRDGEDMYTNTASHSNEDMWSHLSRVLDLQNQITRMHVEMEGVGLGKQIDGKGKGPLGSSSRPTGFSRPRTTSTSSVPGGDVGDEEGVGAVDEEAEKSKAREREFKNLATQFEGRKEAINAMMGKLDDLSQALAEFHSLQAPKIELPNSSRNNSLNNASTTDQIHMPVIIPPSDTASPVSPGESSLQPPNTATRLPTSYLQPTRHDRASNISSNPASSAQPLPQPLRRKGPAVPALIINSIESDSQVHMIDSPLSTPSLNKSLREEDAG